MQNRIISEGERWSIGDQLDGSIVMTFDSWTHHDPEQRAREAFAAYPRQSNLWYERVVKYENELIDVYTPAPSTPGQEGDRG